MSENIVDENAITKGAVTFLAEGNDIPSSQYYSRVIHYPQTELSGVTIGRGYDLGMRTQTEVYTTLTAAGVSTEQASIISSAAGLRGAKAEEFVSMYKDSIGEITREQEIRLFNILYPVYEEKAKSIYKSKVSDIKSAPNWDELDHKIRDIIVDVIFQGFKGSSTISVATENDRNKLSEFIRNNPELQVYENNRKRAEYLLETE